MKKGFAAALLVVTLTLNVFAADTVTPNKHKSGTTTTTTTTWINKVIAVFYNLI